MASKPNKKVLIVSEYASSEKLLKYALMNEGFSPEKLDFSSNTARYAKTSSKIPDLIIYDMPWRYCEGQELCKCVEQHLISKETPRIVISTFLIDCTECEKYQNNQCAHFQKPFSVSDLMAKVKDLSCIKMP